MSLPQIAPEAAEVPQSPAGGRPFEWRALEEAAAFEKWFVAGDEAGSGATAPRGEPQASRSPNPGAPGRDVATQAPARSAAALPPAAVPAAAGESTPRAAAQAAAPAAVADAAPALVAGAVRAPHSVLPRATVEPVSAQAAPHWSRLAVSAVLSDEKVRVYLRDNRLGEAEIEVLRQALHADLRRLGYRLALFMVNGESRHGD